jgi:integration host factor subunit beta
MEGVDRLSRYIQITLKNRQKMQKSVLITKIAARQESLSLQEVAQSVDEIVRCLMEALCKKERIDVRRFGNLTAPYYAPKEAHNPKTNRKVTVPGRYKVRFKMGGALKKQLNHCP